MPFNTNITPGRPPVLWSEVNDAFIKVNENFDILVATIGDGSGLTPIDFTSLDTAVKPTTSNLYDLGDITHQWRSVFTGEHTTTAPLNGLWAGSAQVKGVGYTINLPTGSTVGGDPITGIGADLIIDPNKTFFKEIQVNNELSVVATTFGDTINFLSGSGVGLAVSSGADSITFSNTGVLSVTAGAGITAATVSGVATITNTGVRSLQSTVALPSGRTTGAGINITGSTGDNLRVTNTGVISISSGVGITVSLDAGSGDVTITNSAPAVNAFTQVVVNGDTSNILAADAASDVLNITSDATITLTKTVGTDTLNIAVNPVFDLKGSVFGDDSSVIVNAIDRVVTAAGGFIGNLTGNVTGSLTGTVQFVSTNTTAATHYITFADVSTGNEFIRTDTSLTYNPSTNTLTVGTLATGSLTITGSTIGTTDSSGIIINELTTFNTDVTFENDITVTGQVTIGGDLIINGTTTTINSVTLTVDDKNIELGSTASPTDVTADGGGITLKGSTDKTFTYVNSTGLWTANIGIAATSFTGLAAAATTASTAASVGYMGIPQSATTTTLVIGDAGKHIYVNTSGQTLTIPAATSVAYPIGTTLTFIAGPSASTVTIAITTDTMYLTGTGTTGSRTLAAHGMATAVKVSGTSSSGVWYINGSGLT
jgi:hypothetical protein